MLPRPPLPLAPVFDDPEVFFDLVRSNGPFPSLQQRVMQSAVESAAITSEWVTDEMIDESQRGGSRSLTVTPSYRSYWARYGQALRDDAAWLLRYERFVDGARRLHAAPDAIVRPDEIYVNVQAPSTVRPGSSHVDIPKFRGMGRREYPVWLLTTMRRAGLFERWRVPVATAVCWFYDGPGGTYTYWPNGPDGPAAQTTHPFSNTALVGENDTMFHRGDGFDGPPTPQGLTLDCVCEPVEGGWQIRDGDRVRASYGAGELRIALSWSAEVYVDDEQRRVADDHLDDLDLATVIDLFVDDLARRGQPVERPPDPLRDLAFIARLARTYRVLPRQYPTHTETAAVAASEARIAALAGR